MKKTWNIETINRPTRIKLFYALSRLVLQGVLYLQIYSNLHLLEEHHAKMWNESFFIGSILSLLACGERHLSEKNNWNQNPRDTIEAYLSWPTGLCATLSVLSLLSLFLHIQLSSLLIIIAVECLYADLMRSKLLTDDIVGASKITIGRSLIHITSIIALYSSHETLKPYLPIAGYVAVGIYLIANGTAISWYAKNTVKTQIRLFNPSFTLSAVLARATFIIDKLLVSFSADITISTKYALITGIASAAVGIIDNILLQPKIILIVNKNETHLNKLKKLLKYLLTITITLLAVNITLIFIFQKKTYGQLEILLHATVTMFAYLCLIVYSYKCTSERKPNLIKLSSVLPIFIFYFYITNNKVTNIHALFNAIAASIVATIGICIILERILYARKT